MYVLLKDAAAVACDCDNAGKLYPAPVYNNFRHMFIMYVGYDSAPTSPREMWRHRQMPARLTLILLVNPWNGAKLCFLSLLMTALSGMLQTLSFHSFCCCCFCCWTIQSLHLEVKTLDLVSFDDPFPWCISCSHWTVWSDTWADHFCVYTLLHSSR